MTGRHHSSSAIQAPRYRWTILGAGVVAQASFSAIFFGLPALAPAVRAHYDLSLPEVGLVLAALNVGLLSTLLLWGIVADRFGERIVLSAGLAGCGGALLLVTKTSSLAGLVAALAVAGALGGGTQTASGRAVMSWFGPEERGFALGIRQTAVPLGGAIAAVTLPALADHEGLDAAFIALGLGCIAAAAVCVTLIRREPSGDQAHPGQPLRDPRIWRLCLGSTFYVATQISLLGFLVLFLHDERGVSATAGAAVLAVTQALGGVARIGVGRWSDRRRERIALLLRLGLLLAATALVAALLLSASLWLLLPALVVAGTCSLAWNGLSFTATAEIAGRSRAGAAIGLQQSFLAAGSIVAPITFSAVVHAASWRLAFLLAAVSPLVGYALLRDLPEPATAGDPDGRRRESAPQSTI
jgi:sugar phosphate permease